MVAFKLFNNRNPKILFIIVLMLSLLIGFLSSLFSPLWVLAGIAALAFLFVLIKRPEIGLFAILITTSSIVFEDQLPLLHLGGISLNISDIILLMLLGLILLRSLAEPGFKIVHTPLDGPLLIFYGLTLLSTFIAINNSALDVVVARRMIRYMSYYLTFFIVTNLVRDRRQLNLLLNGILLLATIVAAAMVVQFLLGDSVRILPGTVESLWTQGTMYEDITRIVPPGFSIILVSFFTLLCILVLERFKPIRLLIFLQCGLMGFALLLTFFRSYWAALIIVFLLLVYLCRGSEMQRLIGWGLVIIVLAGMIPIVLSIDSGSRAARLAGALTDRLSTLGSSGTFQGQDSSLNWRMLEIKYAVVSIASHPAIGLGMGASYRPYDPRLDVPGSNYDFTKHIHNGHLWILLDTGVLGYLSLMWLSFAFLIRGFRYWRKVANDRMKAIVLGFTLLYVAVLIAAVANSSFVQWNWVPVIGIIMGINEVILGKVGQGALAVWSTV